jgi:hypothetical protein
MMLRFLAVLAVATAIAGPAAAQVKCTEGLPPVDRDAQSRMTVQEFIREVTAKELASTRAFADFGYTIDATVQTLSGEAVDGEYRHVSTVSVEGATPRRDVATSVNTLKRVKFGDRDLETLREALTLTPERISGGDIVYSGRQRIGEINATLFNVLPRNRDAEIRGFEGRVWVRAREDAVMRLCGRSSAAPIGPMRFEVVREPVAEKYWFPVSIRADEQVPVGGEKVHVRVTVTYSNYKAR